MHDCTQSRSAWAATSVVVAGIVAAIHVGKLPPTLTALREDFGMSLFHASFMVSAFQVAGMTLGIVGGMLADRFGARRVMVIGELLVGLAALVALGSPSAGWLLVTRVLESAGFMLTVLPGPVMLRRVVAPGRLSVWLGYWGSYMPAGMGFALFVAPALVASGGWRAIWLLSGVLSIALALLHARLLPDDPPRTQASQHVVGLLGTTMASPGPWVLALGFCCYAAQWMGVFSFLPTIYSAAGIGAGLAGLLTAVAVSVNLVGNVLGGRLAQRQAPAPVVLAVAALAMGVFAWMAFGASVPFAAQFVAVLLFSSVGGLIPGTLFSMSPRLAPSVGAISTTVGLMQQGSALGQFVSPPVLAWLAMGAEGWSLTWKATAVFAMGDLLAALLLAWLLKRRAGRVSPT